MIFNVEIKKLNASVRNACLALKDGRGYVSRLFRSFSISSGLFQLHDWAHWVSTLIGSWWFVLGSLKGNRGNLVK